MRYAIALEQGGWVVRDHVTGRSVTPPATSEEAHQVSQSGTPAALPGKSTRRSRLTVGGLPASCAFGYWPRTAGGAADRCTARNLWFDHGFVGHRGEAIECFLDARYVSGELGVAAECVYLFHVLPRAEADEPPRFIHVTKQRRPPRARKLARRPLGQLPPSGHKVFLAPGL